MSQIKRILIAGTRPEVGRLGATANLSDRRNSLFAQLKALKRRELIRISLTLGLFVILNLTTSLGEMNGNWKAVCLVVQVVLGMILLPMIRSYSFASFLLKLLPDLDSGLSATVISVLLRHFE